MHYSKKGNIDRKSILQRQREEMEEQQYYHTLWRKQELQRKATEIDAPDSVHEKQADAIGRKVANNENAADLVKNHPKAEVSKQTSLQDDRNTVPEVTPEIQTKLDSTKGGGKNLDANTKSSMEQNMGVDLSGVKIHTDSKANELSESINAKAFTHEQDVYFKEGNYNTESKEGKELLGHELAHTVQQNKGLSRKIQRKEYRPQEFANNYFKGVSGYSFESLQKYLSSDGSGKQNMHLQDVLSAIIYMNKALSPQQVWNQLSIDPTQLRGYNAFIALETGAIKPNSITRNAADIKKVKNEEEEVDKYEPPQVDYAITKNFLVQKRKREQARKDANKQANDFINASAAKIQTATNEIKTVKTELETNVQRLFSKVNSWLISEATDKEKTTYEKIASIKVNATEAKKGVVNYYYGSLTVIRVNSDKQRLKLERFKTDAEDKLLLLGDVQKMQIDALYNKFRSDVEGLLPGLTKEIMDAGRKRYEQHQSRPFASLLSEGKGLAVVKASQESQLELSMLATKTIDSAHDRPEDEIPEEYTQENKTKTDYESENLNTQGYFGSEIRRIYREALELIDSKEILDKQAAKLMKDGYKSRIDEITLGVIQSLMDSLDIHHKQIYAFGDKQDALVLEFYNKAVTKLDSTPKQLIDQAKAKLETFSTGQKNMKTPEKEQLTADISTAEAETSNLVKNAEKDIIAIREDNKQGLINLENLVLSNAAEFSNQHTVAMNNLLTSGSENMTEVEKASEKTQLKLREDHLKKIIHDVNTAQKNMDAQVTAFYEFNTTQLEEINSNLEKRLAEFEKKAKEIVDALDDKMNKAEQQAEKDNASGKLQRNRNVRNFEEAYLKLSGTEKEYKIYEKIQDILLENGYDSEEGDSINQYVYENFENILNQIPGLAQLIDKLNPLLKAHGFENGILEYSDTLFAFESGFKKAVSSMAIDSVDDYDKKLDAAQKDYESYEYVDKLFKENPELWETIRELNDYQDRRNDIAAITHPKTSIPDPGGSDSDRRLLTPEEKKEMEILDKKTEASGVKAREMMRKLYKDHPIFDDEDIKEPENTRDERFRLPKRKLAEAKSTAEMQTVLLDYIAKRKKDVADAKEELLEDEGTDEVYNLDKLLPYAFKRYGIDPKSFPGTIIQNAMDAKHTRDLIWNIILAIVTIVLAVLSDGLSLSVTSVGGLAGWGLVAISIEQAYVELDEFDKKMDLYRVGLADEPSFIWVMIALVGSAMDLGPIFKTLKPASAVKLKNLVVDFDATGDAVKFAKEVELLEKTAELSSKLTKPMLKAAAKRTGYTDAVKEFNTMFAKSVTGIDVGMLKPLSKMAYFKMMEGVANFEQFMLIIKHVVKRGLSTEELKIVKQAYREAKEGVQAGTTKYADDVAKSLVKSEDELLENADEAADAAKSRKKLDADDIDKKKVEKEAIEDAKKAGIENDPDYAKKLAALVEAKIITEVNDAVEPSPFPTILVALLRTAIPYGKVSFYFEPLPLGDLTLNFEIWMKGSKVKVGRYTVEIPNIRTKQGEMNFMEWFNTMHPDDFDELWKIPAVKEIIDAKIRQPGGLHEWLMVARANVFKRWGVSMEEIKELRTMIKETKFVDKMGNIILHGEEGSTKAHNQILKLIDKSSTYEEFARALNKWADKNVYGKRAALPKDLIR